MKILENNFDCVGCGLCAYSCPKKCITMEAEQGGFCYPHIDENLCVSCGKCQQLCPVRKEKTEIKPLSCYAMIDNRHQTRLMSASGGAAGLFLEKMVENDGAICGCRLDEGLKPVHDVSFEKEDVDLYRDSKYVQSDMLAAWEKIDEQVKKSREILISGTPCQIAAVHSLYGENEKIKTLDFVCSGVPDPSIFELYKKSLERQQGKTIREFYFRDKTNGWKKSNIRVVYDDNSEQIIERKDSDYFRLFGNNLFFRECCYKCKFKGFNTYADVTVGDYWGIEKKYPEIDDDKGCSLVIVNTNKGEQMLSEVEPCSTIKETGLDFAIETHPKLIKSIIRSKYRDLFYKIYKINDEKSLNKAMKRCMGHSLSDKVMRLISTILK